MPNREKLPRLPRYEKYVTGDAQDWTYDYTWEDHGTMMRHLATSIPIVEPTSSILTRMMSYFKLQHIQEYVEDETAQIKGEII